MANLPVHANLDFQDVAVIVGLDATETKKGVAEVATQAEVDAGVDDARFVTPAKLAAWTGAGTAKFATDVGDGAATTYTVTHNLATFDLLVQVRANGGSKQYVGLVDVDLPTNNTARVTFLTAPALNAYRVVVVG